MSTYGPNPGLTNRTSPTGHNYGQVQFEDSDDETSNNLDYLDARETHSTPGLWLQDEILPESDIASHIDNPGSDYQTNPRSQPSDGSVGEHSPEQYLMRSIPRKPVANATVYSVSDNQPLQASSHTAKEQRPSASLLKIWCVEALCCLLVVVTVFAMVITVYSYEGQPLPQWKYGIGISSFLAIYGIIFRAAAGFVLSTGLGQLTWTLFRSPRPLHDLHIYDESTRGPLGCIQLLSSFRGAQIAARLGAVATLALLILDPFTQQLLGFKNCSVPAESSNATLPRSSAFYGNGLRLWTAYVWPESEMQSAANAGLYAVNATLVKANCGTGNCSYSSTSLFHTVGYCHRCYDVTTQLLIVTTDTPNPYNESSTISTTTITLEGYNSVLSTNSTEQLMMIAGARRQEEFDEEYHKNYSFTFIIPGHDANTVWRDTLRTRAFSCNFEMCVRTMNSSVIRGSLDEVTVATHNSWSGVSSYSGNWTRSMIDITCLSSGQKAFLANAGYKFASTDAMIPYNGSLLANGTVVPGNFDITGTGRLDVYDPEWLSTIPAKCIYSVSAQYSDGMQQFFTGLFSGELPSYEKDTIERGSAVLNNLRDRGATLDTFDEAMGNIADSMTSYMRQTSVANFNFPVAGIEYVATACVEPRWQWIAYVAAVAAMVIGFFVAMLIETGINRNGWRHDFKSSAMALICAGLDEDSRHHLVPALKSGRSDDLQVAAKRMVVHIERVQVKFIHQD